MPRPDDPTHPANKPGPHDADYEKPGKGLGRDKDKDKPDPDAPHPDQTLPGDLPPDDDDPNAGSD